LSEKVILLYFTFPFGSTPAIDRAASEVTTAVTIAHENRLPRLRTDTAALVERRLVRLAEDCRRGPLGERVR
jgi:hypothetical protein